MQRREPAVVRAQESEIAMSKTVGRSVVGPVLLGVVLAACGPTLPLPPPSASPQTVLETYLRALVAGECSVGRQLGADGFGPGRGDLCGATRVASYRIDGPPAAPTANELVFSTSLTTSGTSDGTIRAGSIGWFFTLDRKANGSWRITGAGSGP